GWRSRERIAADVRRRRGRAAGARAGGRGAEWETDADDDIGDADDEDDADDADDADDEDDDDEDDADGEAVTRTPSNGMGAGWGRPRPAGRRGRGRQWLAGRPARWRGERGLGAAGRASRGLASTTAAHRPAGRPPATSAGSSTDSGR